MVAIRLGGMMVGSGNKHISLLRVKDDLKYLRRICGMVMKDITRMGDSIKPAGYPCQEWVVLIRTDGRIRTVTNGLYRNCQLFAVPYQPSLP